MSLLDVLNKKQSAAAGMSFTQQATQMKAALTGKEQESAPIEKSEIGEQVEKAKTTEVQKGLLQEAQTTQQKADMQSAEIQQSRRLLSNEYKQKEAEMVSQNQRQLNQVYTRLSQSYKDLDADQKIANMEQLEFLHNMSDRKYVDKIQIEGDKRRLDDAVQLKSAIMYATFEEQIDQLNEDTEFQRSLNADDRTWTEYLATIDPEAAIQASLMSYKSQQSQKAYEGMAEGVVTAGKTYASSITPGTPEGTEIKTAMPGEAGSGVLKPEYITTPSITKPGY